MKYTLVYRDKGDGYSWHVRNEAGLYAARATHLPFGGIRRWRSSSEASAYVERYMGCPGNHDDFVWLEVEWDRPYIGGKPGATSMQHKPSTAASYKHSHGGYPNSPGRVPSSYCPSAHMKQRWAEQRARTTQPLVWPTIPQVDDGSNEEATTVPDSLVQDTARRVFIINLRNAFQSK